jgi:hypothetical protein
MIDPTTLQGASHAAASPDRATVEYVPDGWPEAMFRKAAGRFEESRARITFAQDVRHENIVVPIPDSLLSDDEIDFVTYIDPSRKTIESGWKQSLAEHPPVYERPPISGSDKDERDADMVETVANALRETIVNWDGLVGKAVEDGEVGVTVQYELEDFFSAPQPSDILEPADWKKLPKKEQDDWTEVDLGQGRISYRRYRQAYWRDADGRKRGDAYYRRSDDDGERKTFKRDDLATRRAWREHAKSWRAGQIPLTVRLVPAANCAPLLVAGTDNERWRCRGLAIREQYAIDDLVARGYAWTGLGTELYPIAFDGSASSKSVWVYQVHCWLEADDGEPHPCVVTSIDGQYTEQRGAGAEDYRAAIVDLKAEYGLSILPANYYHFAHTEADDPDRYAYPAMYPLMSSILNREGTLTAYQTHIRKYALGKLATVPNPDVPSESWLSADGSPKPIDLTADIITLPGPVAPLAQPPAPNAVRDLLLIYSQDVQANSPGEQTRGAGDSDASGHSLQLQQGYFLSANRHILEGCRKAVEWIGETALEMLAALEDQYGTKASVFVREKPPADAQPARRRGQAIEIDSRWFKGNFTLVARYPEIGNLAEVQQLADLSERGLASFADVMEARGKTSTFNERVAIAIDAFWKSEQGQQLLMLTALKQRGDMERAAILEAQMQGDLQPGGLPSDAVPPELAMMQGQQMPGVQLPNMAASQLGGTVAGAIGAGAQLNDAAALAGAGLPGGGGI